MQEELYQKYNRFCEIQKRFREDIYFKASIDPFKLISILSKMFIKLNVQYVLKNVELQNIPEKIIFTNNPSFFNDYDGRCYNRSSLSINNINIRYITYPRTNYNKCMDPNSFFHLLRTQKKFSYINSIIRIIDNNYEIYNLVSSRLSKYDNILLSSNDLKVLCDKLRLINTKFNLKNNAWYIDIIYKKYLKNDINKLDNIIIIPQDEYTCSSLFINTLKEINNWYYKNEASYLIIKNRIFGPISISEYLNYGNSYKKRSFLDIKFLDHRICYKIELNTLLNDPKYENIIRLISYYVDNYPGGKNFVYRLKHSYLKQAINID